MNDSDAFLKCINEQNRRDALIRRAADDAFWLRLYAGLAMAGFLAGKPNYEQYGMKRSCKAAQSISEDIIITSSTLADMLLAEVKRREAKVSPNEDEAKGPAQ